MKLVITIGPLGVEPERDAHAFARTVATLLSDGHCLTVVHGGARPFLEALIRLEDNRLEAREEQASCGHDVTSFLQLSELNKKLVGALVAVGVTAFGLCGADGNIVKTRRRQDRDPFAISRFEVATVNSFWIQLICEKGGVPVLASTALGPDGRYHCLEADQLSAACAVSWKADGLIFLTRGEGVVGSNGSVLRWIERENIDACIRSYEPSHEMVSKLRAGNDALRHGVHRVRFLPASEIESLVSFYSSRIEAGTEVI